MLIGNKSELAFEWSLVNAKGDAQYIEFRLWAGDVEIGLYEDYELLSSVCSYLRQFLDFASERFLPEMDQSPPEEVLTRVFGMMESIPPGHAGDWLRESRPPYPPDQYFEDSRLRRIFHLDDVIGSPFRDKFNVMLMNLSSRSGQRLIWRNLDTMKVGEVELPDQLFDRLAAEFLSLVCPGNAPA